MFPRAQAKKKRKKKAERLILVQTIRSGNHLSPSGEITPGTHGQSLTAPNTSVLSSGTFFGYLPLSLSSREAE